MTSLLQPLQWSVLAKQFLPRDSQAHKGAFGHVLVVGGDYGMAGAVRMAGEAALRVGAGLVSVATHREHLSVVNSGRPEILCRATETISDLLPLLQKATVIVCGPGLGQSTWSHALWKSICETTCPKVIDADALRLLAAQPIKKSDWILTPHPGEAAALLNTNIAMIQSDRASAANAIVKRYGGVVVLKGAGSIVQSENDTPHLCTTGNPGMASAGMGDVLSGVIGGLLAQQFSFWAAAATGTVLHGMAGDQAAAALGARGLLAMDLMPHLEKLVNPQ
ncbi:MAG: NAD(P)H-hydrate dehydratase [Coxiellaceae bacterium]|nr:NAD(P)H-hydrate dehydratase [Coxiellaceae bacterium]